MVDQAMERYCLENKLPLSSKSSFFSVNSSIYSGTSAYLARACVENLINFSSKSVIENENESELNCQVS
jgi:hypothetical protein